MQYSLGSFLRSDPAFAEIITSRYPQNCLEMAAFFRRTLHNGYRVNHTNSCLIKRYGTDHRVKLKAFGLVSYSQMQQGKATASSEPDGPELQAASIAGNPIVGANSYSLNSYPSVLSDFDHPVSKSRASLNRTAYGTLQRTTSTVKEITGFFNTKAMKTISHQLQSQNLDMFDNCQNDDVPTLFVHLRKLSSKSGFKGHSVHFSNNHLLKQRANGGFLKTDSAVRHYATGPRARRKMEKSYYEVLNTTPSATQAQVKEAYFKLSKIYHPDKNAGSKEAQRKFAAINEAYSVLGNVTLRKRYDRGTLNQRDVHGEVKPEEKAAEEEMSRDPMYAASGVPFSVEAKRHAKNMDDFFSKHYKDARDKEQRDRAERRQRIDEYMELQKRAKLSPVILAVFMISALVMGIKSVTQNSALKAQGTNKDN